MILHISRSNTDTTLVLPRGLLLLYQHMDMEPLVPFKDDVHLYTLTLIIN